MNKLIEFSSFLAIGCFSLASVGCDDGGGSKKKDDGVGANSGAGGSGGASGAGFGGASGTGVGGSSGSGSGGAAGTGFGGSAGSGGAGASTGGVELVNDEGWVGEDPASTADNPLGIQGAWYVYGDNTSCTAEEGFNPCATGKCCLSGATIVDPTFAAWGCGIGLSLNATGDTDAGPGGVKSAYAGPARSFVAQISGSTGPNAIRVNVTQVADTTGKVSPYKEVQPLTGAAVTQTILFSEVVYPTWCEGNDECTGAPGVAADPTKSYDIQFQIPGGEEAAAFDFCIESLKASP
jgi:hypothetical protein